MTEIGTVQFGVESRTFIDGPFDRVDGPLSRRAAELQIHITNQGGRKVARLIERSVTAWSPAAVQPVPTDPRQLGPDSWDDKPWYSHG